MHTHTNLSQRTELAVWWLLTLIKWTVKGNNILSACYKLFPLGYHAHLSIQNFSCIYWQYINALCSIVCHISSHMFDVHTHTHTHTHRNTIEVFRNVSMAKWKNPFSKLIQMFTFKWQEMEVVAMVVWVGAVKIIFNSFVFRFFLSIFRFIKLYFTLLLSIFFHTQCFCWWMKRILQSMLCENLYEKIETL